MRANALDYVRAERDWRVNVARYVENGGALLVPRGDGSYDAIPRGATRSTLVRALDEIAREAMQRLILDGRIQR